MSGRTNPLASLCSVLLLLGGCYAGANDETAAQTDGGGATAASDGPGGESGSGHAEGTSGAAPDDGSSTGDATEGGSETGDPMSDGDIDQLQIPEFAHDQVVFDGGTHRGFGYADILFPLSASDDSLEGETIQMRVADEDGGHSWADIGEVHDRTLEALVRHARTPQWQTPTFRVRNGDGRTKAAANRFAVGSIIAYWGQSDLFHVYYLGRPDVPGPQVEGDDCLQVAMIHDRGLEPQPASSGIRRFADDDWPDDVLARSPTMPAGLAEAAAAVHDAGCYKTMLLLHQQSGMGISHQALETNPNWTDTPRHGEDERLIHDSGITEPQRGQRVGYVSYFFSSASTAQFSNAEFLAAAVFGTDEAARPRTFPTDIEVGDGTVEVTFSMGELYDWSYARFGYIAPYGQQAAYLTTLSQMSVGAFADMFVDDPIGPRPFGFVKGENDGAQDDAHPALDTPYGSQRAGQIYTRDLLRRSGASPGVTQVALDTVELHPTGDSAMLAVGWSGGDVTTPHLADGRSRLGGRPDVRRFSLDGTLLERAFIRDEQGNLATHGRIWLQKNDGSDWSASDVAGVAFGSVNQSSMGVGEDVASGWTFGHDAALTIDGGYTMANPSPRYADLFTDYEAHAP